MTPFFLLVTCVLSTPHERMNDLIKRVLQKAGLPSAPVPPGLYRELGHVRPDNI